MKSLTLIASPEQWYYMCTIDYIINESIFNIFSASPVYATVSEDFKQKSRRRFWVCWKLSAAVAIKPDCCRPPAVVSIFTDSAAWVTVHLHSTTPLHTDFWRRLSPVEITDVVSHL